MGEKYVKNSKPGAGGVIFYSALFGSGYPTWDTNATGMFLGLRSTTSKADIVRSVMEGITLESRHILESVLAAGVEMDDVISISGGVSKSPEWRQIVADIMGRKIRTLNVPDTALIGAAGLAAIGAGLCKDMDEAVSKMVSFSETVDPIPENVKLYDKIFGVYKDAYYALKGKDVFSRLSNLRPAE
jgi:xylulokinase